MPNGANLLTATRDNIINRVIKFSIDRHNALTDIMKNYSSKEHHLQVLTATNFLNNWQLLIQSKFHQLRYSCFESTFLFETTHPQIIHAQSHKYPN